MAPDSPEQEHAPGLWRVTPRGDDAKRGADGPGGVGELGPLTQDSGGVDGSAQQRGGNRVEHVGLGLAL